MKGGPVQIPIGESEARFALGAVEHRRQQVLEEISVPLWYWVFLAAGWVALGGLGDFGPAWSTWAGTLLFGAVHSAIAPRVISGRRGSTQLSIRSELVSRRLPALILGFVMAMAAVTVAFALLLHADGAGHPSLDAGVIVGMLVLVGGPSLVMSLRRRLIEP
jgi:hypothetical protein